MTNILNDPTAKAMAKALANPAEARARVDEEVALHEIAVIMGVPFKQAEPLIQAYREETKLTLAEIKRLMLSGALWHQDGRIHPAASAQIVPFEHELEKMAARLPYSLSTIRNLAEYLREMARPQNGPKLDDRGVLKLTRAVCEAAATSGVQSPVGLYNTAAEIVSIYDSPLFTSPPSQPTS